MRVASVVAMADYFALSIYFERRLKFLLRLIGRVSRSSEECSSNMRLFHNDFLKWKRKKVDYVEFYYNGSFELSS